MAGYRLLILAFGCFDADGGFAGWWACGLVVAFGWCDLYVGRAGVALSCWLLVRLFVVSSVLSVGRFVFFIVGFGWYSGRDLLFCGLGWLLLVVVNACIVA